MSSVPHPPGPLRRLLERVGRLVGRRPGTVLAVIGALTLAALPFAARTVLPRNMEKDLLEVLTRGMPRAEAYRGIAEDFGVIDRHFVLVEVDREADLPDAKRLAEALVGGLTADPELVVSARCRVDLREFFQDYAHLFLDETTAQALAEKLTDKAIKDAMRENRGLLRTAGATFFKERVLRDPLGLIGVLRESASRRGGGRLPVDSEGFLVSENGRAVLVDVRPTQPAARGEEDDFTGRLLRHTEAAIAQARADCFGGDPAAGARVRTAIGGSYAGLREGGWLIVRGILTSATTSLLGILLLFALAYRRPAAFLLIGLPLAVPVVWTLAVTPALLPDYGGRLSVLGGSFAAVLLGLGIDYAVHTYDRFQAELAAGRVPAEAAQISVATTGEGIVLGALTTATAFAGMTLTHFRGFREFGRMASLGIMLTMTALLFGLPAGLVVLERLRPRRRAAAGTAGWLAAAAGLVRSRPRWLFAAGLLLLAVSVGAMFSDRDRKDWGVWFEPELAAVGPAPGVEKVGVINHRAATAFGLDYREVSVIVSAESAAEAMKKTATLRERARSCDLVISARGVCDLVPSPEAQAQSMALVEKLQLGELPERLERAAADAGFGPGVFRDCAFSTAVSRMAARARSGATLEIEKLVASTDPALETVRELAGHLYRPPDRPGEPHRTQTLLSVVRQVNGMSLRSPDYARLGRELGANGRDVLMTSYVLVAYELKDSVRSDLRVIILLVGAVVLCTMLLGLRRPVYLLLALAPVFIGGAAMLLVMKFTGMKLNYMNVLVFPILIGIGVDNAVHLIVRYKQEGQDTRAAVEGMGRPLTLCALTTILGFLSLLTCPHRGLKSLGVVVAIAMGFALLVSLFFVPAALELVARRDARRAERKRPGPDDSARPQRGSAP